MGYSLSQMIFLHLFTNPARFLKSVGSPNFNTSLTSSEGGWSHDNFAVCPFKRRSKRNSKISLSKIGLQFLNASTPKPSWVAKHPNGTNFWRMSSSTAGGLELWKWPRPWFLWCFSYMLYIYIYIFGVKKRNCWAFLVLRPTMCCLYLLLGGIPSKYRGKD